MAIVYIFKDWHFKLKNFIYAIKVIPNYKNLNNKATF